MSQLESLQREIELLKDLVKAKDELIAELRLKTLTPRVISAGYSPDITWSQSDSTLTGTCSYDDGDL